MCAVCPAFDKLIYWFVFFFIFFFAHTHRRPAIVISQNRNNLINAKMREERASEDDVYAPSRLLFCGSFFSFSVISFLYPHFCSAAIRALYKIMRLYKSWWYFYLFLCSFSDAGDMLEMSKIWNQMQRCMVCVRRHHRRLSERKRT